MTEHPGRVTQRALVGDDGQWYDAGTTVRLERAPSQPGQLRLVVDEAGGREVLGCRRLQLSGRPMLEVLLRPVQPG